MNQKAMIESVPDYQTMYFQLKADYDSLYSQYCARYGYEVKQAAAREFFRSRGITGKCLDIAVCGASKILEETELNGLALADTSGLQSLVDGVFSGLVTCSEAMTEAAE